MHAMVERAWLTFPDIIIIELVLIQTVKNVATKRLIEI